MTQEFGIYFFDICYLFAIWLLKIEFLGKAPGWGEPNAGGTSVPRLHRNKTATLVGRLIFQRINEALGRWKCLGRRRVVAEFSERRILLQSLENRIIQFVRRITQS